VPWLPELFSAPALQQLQDKRRLEEELSVPYFYGLETGEIDALVESFAGEPELYDPVRGRVRGVRAFVAFVDELRAWLAERHVTVEDVQRVILEGRGFEEVILHVDGPDGRLAVPFALVADHGEGGRLGELRIYYGDKALTGRSANRPPLLQPDPELREPDVVAEYTRALAAREIPLELCAIVDDGRSCALEYNVVGWGATVLPPQAGMAVFVRGDGGRLAAVRVYGDTDPPLLRSQPWNGA